MSLLRKTGKFSIYERDGHLKPNPVIGTIESVRTDIQLGPVFTPRSRKELVLVDIKPSDGSPTVTGYVLKIQPQ